jgi:DNA ligase (NAD+)
MTFTTTIPSITDINGEDAQLIISTMNTEGFSLRDFCKQLDDNSLINFAQFLNHSFRANKPLVLDSQYDHEVLAEIAERDPEHEFLNTVEDESDSGGAEGKLATLPARMLSTNKAYSRKEIDAWLSRVNKAANEINFPISDIELRITPKLDGFASYDDGTAMYTRGNGIRGTDISYLVDNGVQRFGDAPRGLGAGEIVVDPAYFEENLSGAFENTRNVISGVLRITPTPLVKKAIEEGGVVFAPFSELSDTVCSRGHFDLNFDNIVEKARTSVEFDIDGVIIEVTNKEIKAHMGATQKAHKWMIALKENEAPVQIPVKSVTPQTSRKGRVVPVLELEPTFVSGATVSRVTGHNYTNIKNNGIGNGAVINLVRSGLVIPKIVSVETSVTPELPTECPSCGETLEWGNEKDGTEMDLICVNVESCPAQAQKRLLHWFTTLENVDGFGPSTIKTLSDAGINSIPAIYSMGVADFVRYGFGEKTALNLVNELERSRTEAVEDYRFLAAFGIRTLGRSMSEKILSHHSLDDVFLLSEKELITIDKVGEIKARCIAGGLITISEAFNVLHKEIGFNLIITPLASEAESIESPIAGKTVVFTGTMLVNSRKDMEKEAKALGATIGKSVSGNTDILITGEKVGASKTKAAEKHGTTVLSESEYNELIKGLAR